MLGHKVGTTEFAHIRSIWHPLIRAPNDVLFNLLDEMHVTNDHLHREETMRLLEDLAYGSIVPTDPIHLKLANPLAPVVDDTEGVVGTVANKGIHNNNGLGHRKTPSEVDQQQTPALKISI